MLPDSVEEHSGGNRPTTRPILVEFQNVKDKEKIHTTFREEESRLNTKVGAQNRIGLSSRVPGN